MITDIGTYLRFFDSVRRRTERDVAARPATYAGLQGWPVPDIFARSAETIEGLQPDQHARYRR
jgi:hypothetical protein